MKIKSFVGLNKSGDSFSLTEDSLPNEEDKVYFILADQEYPYDEYYKGIFQYGKFNSALLSFPVEEVESWCLTNDPTAIQRLIFRLDLGFYFDAADWERTIVDGVIEDSYPNPPSAVDIEELELSEQTEILLREYIKFAESHIDNNFEIKNKAILNEVNQRGQLVYEELKKELANKCELIYIPLESYD